jgi:hypothetical protein
MTEYYYLTPVFVDPYGKGYEDKSKLPEVPKFECWFGDDLVQSYKGYLITDNLKNLLDQRNLSGYRTLPTEVTKIDEFNGTDPETTLPDFHVLKITGEGYSDDFGTGYVYNDGEYSESLIVSDRAMDLLDEINLDNAHDVEHIDDEDILLPDTGLEESAKLVLEEPNKRNLAKLSKRAIERETVDDIGTGSQIERLSDLFLEYDDDHLVHAIADSDYEQPSKEDAVSRLLELIEE